MKKFLILSFLLLSSAAGMSVLGQTYDDLLRDAETCIEADSLKQAERLLLQAMELDPENTKNIVLFANLGIVQQRLGKNQEAIDVFSMALDRFPDNVEFLKARADLLLKEGENNRAYLDICKILDAEPKNINALMAHAYLFFSREDYKGACADYKKVLELDPFHYTAKLGLVIAEQKCDHFEKALSLLEEMMAEKGMLPQLLEVKANVLCDMGRYEEALSDISLVLKADKSIATAYVTRGDIWLAKKKRRKAKADYQKALSLGVPYADVQKQLERCR